MALPLLLFAAAAAAPPASPSGPGRVFLSPMGEPFAGRTAGEDGIVPWFEGADRNHDGILSVDEITADAARFFGTLDTNHDGEIDPDEVAHYEQVIAPEVRTGSEIAMGRYALLQIPEPVTSADSDFNRGVSAKEFQAAAVARFRLLDFEHTGRLTRDELERIRHSAASAAQRPPSNKGDPDDQAVLQGDEVDHEAPM